MEIKAPQNIVRFLSVRQEAPFWDGAPSHTCGIILENLADSIALAACSKAISPSAWPWTWKKRKLLEVLTAATWYSGSSDHGTWNTKSNLLRIIASPKNCALKSVSYVSYDNKYNALTSVLDLHWCSTLSILPPKIHDKQGIWLHTMFVIMRSFWWFSYTV